MAELPQLEKANVLDFYIEKANGFSNTRNNYPWKGVRGFCEKIPPGSKLLDVACGNGRNIKHFVGTDIHAEGVDNCQPLLDICTKRGIKVTHADMTNLPFDDNQFDYCICIAAIHHLSTSERRRKAIQEIIRVLKPGGSYYLSVWAYEQPADSKRVFTLGDNMVSWLGNEKQSFLTAKKPFTPKYRYYHVFNKETFLQLIDQLPNATIHNECGNWVATGVI